MPLNPDTIAALLDARIRDPFSLLGLHREGDALWARIWFRQAEKVTVVPVDGSKPIVLTRMAMDGLFEGRIPGRSEPFAYTLQVQRQGEGKRQDETNTRFIRNLANAAPHDTMLPPAAPRHPP